MSKRAVRKLNGVKIIAPVGDADIKAAAEEGKRPSFSMLLYAGGPFRPNGWDKPHPIVLDLAGMSVAQGEGRAIPFNKSHDGQNAIVGHGTPTITATEIRIEDGVFSFDNSHTQEIIEASRHGFPWAASLEATLRSTPEYVASGKTVRVNNRTLSGPVYVARKSELFAGAFIGSNPADRTTYVSVAATENRTMPTALKEWLEARGVEHDSLSDEQIEAFASDFEQIQASKKKPAQEPAAEEAEAETDPIADLRAAHASETRRLAEIRATFGGRFSEVEAECIEKGYDVEASKTKFKIAEYEEDKAAAPAGPAIHSHSQSELRTNDVMAAAMLQCAQPDLRGSEFIAEAFGQKAAESADRLRGDVGLKRLMHETIRAAGGSVDPLTVTGSELIEMAFKADRRLRNSEDIFAASAFSTFSLTDALSNLANKMLMREYRDFVSMVPMICEATEHDDFKDHTKVRLDGDVEALEISPAGEIKHGSLSDSKYTSSLVTMARMLAVTRHDLINDDLGAFSRAAQKLGRGQMRGREKLLFLTLLDSSLTGTFWRTSAGSGQDAGVINRLTSQGSPSVGMLTNAEKLMDEFEDENGDPIMVSPAFILTSTKLRKPFSNILEHSTVSVADDNTTAGSARTEFRVANEYLGRFGLEATPYMNARASIPGSSDTLSFLFADTRDAAAIEYVTLRGMPSPTVQSADTDFNTLGVQMRTYWDIGFAMRDPRGAVRIEG